MSKSIYLVSPRCDFPSYYTAEAFSARTRSPCVLMADLALPTVAGLIPPDFDVRLCDENCSPVDYDADVDYVAITGKISQAAHMVEIARRFRERGKTVVMGGPYVSLSPELLRPYCDVLVRGEIENIAADLFSDLRSGRYKEEYLGDRPEMSACALPKWDGYP